MNAIRRTAQSPALRLKWLERISPPFPPQTYRRNYLIGVGLGLMLVTIVGVGIAVGIVGREAFAAYVQQIIELAWPSHH